MIRVTASSRLHFGPFSLPAAEDAPRCWPDVDGNPTVPARSFGGVGLMVERPGLQVEASLAEDWTAAGPLAARVLEHAKALVRPLGKGPAVRVRVGDGVRAHVGLGTGTQLALAVGRAVTEVVGTGGAPTTHLATILERGKRSALGVHGFDRGGFLIDGGKRSPDEIAPLVARHDFPADWRVLLVIPQGIIGDHGAREAGAFRQLAGRPHDVARTEALCRLALLGMLPALVSRDLPTFGEALYDYNRRAGELFEPWQGGLYSHPRVAELVGAIRAAIPRCGVGQSSWGPSVFAVVHQAEVETLHDWLLRKRHAAADEIVVTAASNVGACVVRE